MDVACEAQPELRSDGGSDTPPVDSGREKCDVGMATEDGFLESVPVDVNVKLRLPRREQGQPHSLHLGLQTR